MRISTHDGSTPKGETLNPMDCNSLAEEIVAKRAILINVSQS